MIEWINIEDQQPTDDDLNKAVAVDNRGQYFILRELCIVTLKGGEIRYISHSTKEFMDVLVGNAEPSTLDDVTHIVAWAPLQRPYIQPWQTPAMRTCRILRASLKSW